MWNTILLAIKAYFVAAGTFPADVSFGIGIPVDHDFPLVTLTFNGEDSVSLSKNNQTGKAIELSFNVWIWEKLVLKTDTIEAAYATIFALENIIRSELAAFTQQTHSGALANYYTETEIVRSSFEDRMLYPQIGQKLECKMIYRLNT